MGILDLLKPKTQELDTSKVIFGHEWLIVGEKYECRKNPKKKRSDVVKKTKIGDAVHVEKYTYEGKAAYMIVNTKLGLDLGVLSSGAADWLTEYHLKSKGTIVAELTDKFQGSFHVQVMILKK